MKHHANRTNTTDNSLALRIARRICGWALPVHALLAAALLLPAMPVSAQPLGIVMQEEPLHIPAVGLDVQLPEGCVVHAGNPETAVRATIRPGEGRWYVSIQSLVGNAGEANAAQLTDDILHRLRKQYGVVRSYEDPETKELIDELIETRVRSIERTPNLTVANKRAERAYVSVPQFSGPNERFLGYTVIETTPTASRWEHWSKISNANDLIRDLTGNDDRCHVIETRSAFLNESGEPRQELFRDDQLHLNADGYKIWADRIRQSLDENLKESL